MMLKTLILVCLCAFTFSHAAKIYKYGEEKLYEKVELEPLTRNNYRSILELGDVMETGYTEFEGRSYRFEEDSIYNAIFVLDDEDNVVSGEYNHEYEWEGETVEALTRIYKNSEGTYVRKITSDHSAWQDPELDGDETEEPDFAWLEHISSRRRNLGGFIEYSVQYYYTEAALTAPNYGTEASIKNEILQGTADTNIVFQNTGLDIIQTIATVQQWNGGAIGTGSSDWYADFVDKFNADMADQRRGDIIALIVNGNEGPAGYCGMARNIPELWGVGYEATSAFFIIQLGCINDGRYVLAHEVGHLLGLGHNEGTSHCNRDGHNACGHIINCGDAVDGGRMTVMSYSSAQMYDMNSVLAHPIDDTAEDGDTLLPSFPCTRDQAGHEKTVPYFSTPSRYYKFNYPTALHGQRMPLGNSNANNRDQIIKAMHHVPSYDDGSEYPACAVNGQRYIENDNVFHLPKVTTTSASLCLQSCLTEDSCEYWNFNDITKECQYVGAKSHQEAHPGIWSGPRVCNEGVEFITSDVFQGVGTGACVDPNGGKITYRSSTSFADQLDCRSACTTQDACIGYQYTPFVSASQPSMCYNYLNSDYGDAIQFGWTISLHNSHAQINRGDGDRTYGTCFRRTIHVQLAVGRVCTGTGGGDMVKTSWVDRSPGAFNPAATRKGCATWAETNQCGRYWMWMPHNSDPSWNQCGCVNPGENCDMPYTMLNSLNAEIFVRLDYTERVGTALNGRFNSDNMERTCGGIASLIHGGVDHCNWFPSGNSISDGRRVLNENPNEPDANGDFETLYIDFLVEDAQFANADLTRPDFIEELDFLDDTIDEVTVIPVDCVISDVEIDPTACTFCGEVLSQNVLTPSIGDGECNIDTYTCVDGDGACDENANRDWSEYLVDEVCPGESTINSNQYALEACFVFCDDYQFAQYSGQASSCECFATCDNPTPAMENQHSVAYRQPRFTPSAYPTIMPSEMPTADAPLDTTSTETEEISFELFLAVQAVVGIGCLLLGIGGGISAYIAFCSPKTDKTISVDILDPEMGIELAKKRTPKLNEGESTLSAMFQQTEKATLSDKESLNL